MNDDNNPKQPILNHLSLCTGYEGIGQGLRRVLPTLREIAYSEIEDYAIANLVTKIEEGRLHPAPIFTNLKTIPYRKFLGKVSVLSGGFPCQGFSQAGLRKGVDDPRHLYPFIAEGISQCKPTFVFLENVSGIISAKTHDGQSVLHYVCQDLESRGYKVSWGIFSASEVGLPHERKRVFIHGISNTERSRLRGGWSSEECRDEREGIHSNKGERNEVRSETEGCSRDIPNTTIRGGRQDNWQRESRLVDQACETRVARPNEPQYEGEAPRVIEVKPRLGGTTNGTTYRHNRLRLLGNGCVPQTVAKAFITLLQKNLTN